MPKLPDYYDRNQLYQEVWEEPIIQVAKRYGVSNVAIAKTCRKMRIPVPGRGYWAKVQNGQKLPKPPLPPYDDCPKIQRIVSSSPSLSVVEPVEVKRLAPEDFELEKLLLEKESDPSLKIIFNPKIKLTHQYVLNTRDRLEKAKKTVSDYYGFGRCKVHQDDSFSVDIGVENIPRVLAILQTLCTALEKRGYILGTEKPKKDNSDTQSQHHHYWREVYPVHATVLDTIIKFKITETSNKRPRDKKIKDSYLHDYKFVPTGKLCFEFIFPPYKNHARTKWYDGKKEKIEDQLNDIIINMIKFVTATKESEAWDRLREEQWKAEEVERINRLELAQMEEARINALVKNSDRLVKFNQVREYYELITEIGKERLGDSYEGSDFSEWVKWAKAFLEENQPEGWELPKFNFTEL